MNFLFKYTKNVNNYKLGPFIYDFFLNTYFNKKIIIKANYIFLNVFKNDKTTSIYNNISNIEFFEDNLINYYNFQSKKLYLPLSFKFNEENSIKTIGDLFLYKKYVEEDDLLVELKNLNNSLDFISNFSVLKKKDFNLLFDGTKLLFFLKRRMYFFNIFLKKFLENQFNSNIFLEINYNSCLNFDPSISFFKRIKKLSSISRSPEISFLTEIVIIALYTKDSVILKNWLKLILEKIEFKLHKRFILAFKYVILILLENYATMFKCLGLCFKISGKIGVGGSAKTKDLWIKYGQFSLTKKKLKMSYSNFKVRTYSGVLGCQLLLTYI